MILCCGIPSEPPIELLARAAESLGIPCVMLGQREAHHHALTIDVDDGGIRGRIRLREGEIDLERITGVYLRFMEVDALPEQRPAGRYAIDANARSRSAVLHQLMLEWLEVAACRVANRPSDAASNVSKPYQASRIAAAGFRIPETLVTNDPAEVEAFLERHGRVVFKSTSSVRSIVTELTTEHRLRLGAVQHLPTQFQELVRGTDVRVHVVGPDLIATEIRSDAIDYRYATDTGDDVRMRPCTLPSDVADRCLALAADLRLSFAGMDLKLTPDGEVYCFEVNPSPAYSYFQQESGQPIATVLARWLSGAGR